MALSRAHSRLAPVVAPLLCLAVGCVASSEPAPRTTTAGRGRDSTGGVPDRMDRCRVLGDCFRPDHADDDGCPDAWIRYRAQSPHFDRQGLGLLRDAVAEIRQLKGKLKRLRIIGHSNARGGNKEALLQAVAVKGWLTKRGVDAKKLETAGRVFPSKPEVYGGVAFELVCERYTAYPSQGNPH